MNTFLIMSSMFMTGFAGLVLQYIQSTIATHILGNSIQQFSLVIGIMIFMMGIASKVQKHIQGNLLEKFILIEIALAIIGGFSPLVSYWAYAYSEHFMLVQYFIIAGLGFLIGLEIPIIMRINQEEGNELSINIDHVFTADYTGSFFGSVIWVFVLLVKYPLTESSFILAGSNYSVALITYSFFKATKRTKNNTVVNIILVLVAIALLLGYNNNRQWNLKLEQHMYEDRIVFTKTTQYQRIVGTINPKLNDFRVYINGNLQFSSIDEMIYHELLVHPAMSAVPHEKVLVIGGGDGMVVREVLKYPDIEEVTLVDLDPGMTEFAANHKMMRKINEDAFHDARVRTVSADGIIAGITTPVFQETDKEDKRRKLNINEEVGIVHIFNADANKFLNRINDKYNVIIIDLPDPSSTELCSLYSKQFFMNVRHALSETGVMVIQSTSPGLAKESYLMIGRTLEAAGFNIMPYHENVPSFGDWGWYLCAKDSLRDDFLENRVDQSTISVKTRYLTEKSFNRARIFGKGELVSKYDTINTVMMPRLLDIYLRECWLTN